MSGGYYFAQRHPTLYVTYQADREDICGVFSTRSQAEAHQKIHDPDPAYQCGICEVVMDKA